MVRTLLVLAAGGGAALLAANNGSLAGYDLFDVPFALLAFIAASAAVLLTLRWI